MAGGGVVVGSGVRAILQEPEGGLEVFGRYQIQGLFKIGLAGLLAGAAPTVPPPSWW